MVFNYLATRNDKFENVLYNKLKIFLRLKKGKKCLGQACQTQNTVRAAEDVLKPKNLSAGRS